MRIVNAVKLAAVVCMQVASALVFAYSTPLASDYMVTPQVNAGSKLIIEFSFNGGATAPINYGANALMVNFGGVGNATSVTSNLYAGSTLIGSYKYPYGGAASAMFVSRDVPFSTGYFWSTVVDSDALNTLLNGSAHGYLELTPLGAGMMWSGWGPHAGDVTGDLQWTDIFPIVNINSIYVIDVNKPINFTVPEPESYILMLTGLGLIGAIAGRRII